MLSSVHATPLCATIKSNNNKRRACNPILPGFLLNSVLVWTSNSNDTSNLCRKDSTSHQIRLFYCFLCIISHRTVLSSNVIFQFFNQTYFRLWSKRGWDVKNTRIIGKVRAVLSLNISFNFHCRHKFHFDGTILLTIFTYQILRKMFKYRKKKENSLDNERAHGIVVVTDTATGCLLFPPVGEFANSQRKGWARWREKRASQ